VPLKVCSKYYPNPLQTPGTTDVFVSECHPSQLLLKMKNANLAVRHLFEKSRHRKISKMWVAFQTV